MHTSLECLISVLAGTRLLFVPKCLVTYRAGPTMRVPLGRWPQLLMCRVL